MIEQASAGEASAAIATDMAAEIPILPSAFIDLTPLMFRPPTLALRQTARKPPRTGQPVWNGQSLHG